MVRALLFGLVFLGMVNVSSAQSSAATSGQPDGLNQTKTPPPTENKKKKVWTNDDVGSGRDGVSVVGAQESGSTTTSPSSCPACSKPSPYERLRKSYRDKLEPLRSNLADIDRKIQMAREAHGNASEDTAAYI
jgi:hypothetical protein